ncbi:hypothetical protein ACK8HX_11825 [Oryzobacter sp. R7]|uniref:hypothetical protein n=1 Tax=Oryzobacter faecalis TaxID=3388656 RepID=UPI00398CF9A8
MSTYGTAVAIDVAPDGRLDSTLAALHDWSAWARPLGDTGWARITLSSSGIERLGDVRHLLTTAGKACAAVAEDNDEHGALWVVLAARPGALRVVHRRYILNADPHDAKEVARQVAQFGEDPRRRDVAGPAAARAAAEMFGVDPGPVVSAEASSDRLHHSIGVVGGPFPWWDALGLTWPGPGAGVPIPPV